MGILDKIKDIEDELARTQKNKATEHHTGLLKGRLAKLRSQLLEIQEKGGGGGDEFEARKSGDARIVLIGFPSVGKSTLLNCLTTTKSEVASYEYTTLTAISGVFHYNGSRIQILDLPGIIEGASKGVGRGKQVISIARTADLILLMCDASRATIHKKLLLKELENSGIRCNKELPQISFHVHSKGHINYTTTVKQTKGVSEKLVKEILRQRKVHHAEVTLREDATVDQLIDIIEGNRRYVKTLFLINKIDTITIEELNELARKDNTTVCSLSLKLNIDNLKKILWEKLDLIRIYSKKRRQSADLKQPYILRNGAKVGTVCDLVHKDIRKKLKYAIVWGKSSKYETGQNVGVNHVLADEDVITLVHKG